MDTMGRLWRFRSLALVAAVVGSSVSAIASSGPAQPAACVLVQVPAIGPACRDADNLWRVPVADGGFVTTHGADPVRAVAGNIPFTAVSGEAYAGTLPSSINGRPLRQPACVTKPDREFHHQVIYAHAADRPSRFTQYRNGVRIMVAGSNGWLRAMAARFDRVMDYRVLCALGETSVTDVTLTTTDERTHFGSIIYDLIAQGYSSPFAKYWIFYDGDARFGAAGVGTMRSSDINSADNVNNFGPGYAVAYDTGLFGSMDTMMHENGHNLGAVQDSAPNSNRGAHCNDGNDIMCYRDPAAPLGTLYRTDACRSADYDCRFNDYFNPRPAKGSYLSTHWNTGSPMNRFIAGCAYRTGLLEVPGDADAPTAGRGTADIAVPKTCVGRPFSVSAVPQYPVAGVTAAMGPVGRAGVFSGARTYDAAFLPASVNAQIPDADVCFYKGTTLLRCHERRGVVERAQNKLSARATGSESGFIPVGTTKARIVLAAGAHAVWVFNTV